MPYIAKIMDDIFDYQNYWSKSAIKRRKKKEKKMYKKSEVNEVLDDVAGVVDGFVATLQNVALDLTNIDLSAVEADAFGSVGEEIIDDLIHANDKLKKIDLIPVIDTLQGILEAEVEDE